MTARRRFEALRDTTGTLSPREVEALWDALPPATIEALTGSRWRGGALATGHRTSRLLEKSRWYGKRFGDRFDVQPMLCRNDDGSIFSDTKSGRGEASLWMIEFRGVVTATMVYDGMAVFDHFKKVDDDTLLGVMNGKPALVEDAGELFWFWLERDSA